MTRVRDTSRVGYGKGYGKGYERCVLLQSTHAGSARLQSSCGG